MALLFFIGNRLDNWQASIGDFCRGLIDFDFLYHKSYKGVDECLAYFLFLVVRADERTVQRLFELCYLNHN